MAPVVEMPGVAEVPAVGDGLPLRVLLFDLGTVAFYFLVDHWLGLLHVDPFQLIIFGILWRSQNLG